MVSKYITLLICVFIAGVCAYPLTAATGYACETCDKGKFVDGRLDDWSESYLTLDGWNWRPAAEVKPIYGGTYDLSATVRMAWDTEYLYLGIILIDDFFYPSPTHESGDSVLLTFAPATSPAPAKLSPVTLAFTRMDETTVSIRNSLGKWTSCPEIKIGVGRNILTPPRTPIPHEETKIGTARITKLFYELSIPWSLLHGINHTQHSAFGLTIEMPDTDDGKVLRGSLKWRGERGAPLTATGFGQVLLVKTAPKGNS